MPARRLPPGGGHEAPNYNQHRAGRSEAYPGPTGARPRRHPDQTNLGTSDLQAAAVAAVSAL